MEREAASGSDMAARIEAAQAEKATLEGEKAELEERWQKEKAAVEKVAELRANLIEAEAGSKESDKARKELVKAEAEVKDLQGEHPMIYEVVDHDVVAEVLAGWTGIPVGRMVTDEINAVLQVKESLGERIKGQDYALEVIGETVRTARAGLADPRKPLGVFLFCGTSGVGKTETALALAELLYGGEHNVTTINMSEFKEEHKVSTLVGAAPGYVGYGEGGVLTEAVRRKPYSVILLDEMEKAHPGVQDVFYQVFDKGMLKDGQGRDIDFKNTLIIMTSNAGTDTIEKLCRNATAMPEPEELATELRPSLLDYFKPAFLGRVVTVPFFPLPPEILRMIVTISMSRIRQRVEGHYDAEFEWEDDLLDTIVSRCTEHESGARNIENILKRGLLADLSQLLLERSAEGEEINTIKVSKGKEKDYAFDIN